MRPLQDLAKQNLLLLPQYQGLLEDFVNSGNYVAGNLTNTFEEALSQYTGYKHAVAVNTGTAALEIALRAIGVSKGDFVGIPAITFVATAQAVISCGAIPVLIDINEKSWNIDSEKIFQAYKIQPFKYLIPVHLHGNNVDLDEFSNMVINLKITVIEDAAQSICKNLNSINSSKLSLAAATSFYPGKNLGSITEGGAILTDSKEIADFARLYRNWGSSVRYHHDKPGGNFRISEFGAGVLSIKLMHLENYISSRRSNAIQYKNLLSNIEGVFLPDFQSKNHTFHIFSILSKHRDKIKLELEKVGFQTGMHYPRSIDQNVAYKANLKYGNLTNAHYFAEKCLSLPMDEFLTIDEISSICEVIKKVHIGD